MDEPSGKLDAAEIIGRIVAEMEEVFSLIGRPVPERDPPASAAVTPAPMPLDSSLPAA